MRESYWPASTELHDITWARATACTQPLPLSRPTRAQDVLICGWGDSTFMVALLHSMDAELPRGSQVTVLNLRPKEEVLGAPAQLPATPAELTDGPALASPSTCCHSATSSRTDAEWSEVFLRPIH